jgi:hypothetical protein
MVEHSRYLHSLACHIATYLEGLLGEFGTNLHSFLSNLTCLFLGSAYESGHFLLDASLLKLLLHSHTYCPNQGTSLLEDRSAGIPQLTHYRVGEPPTGRLLLLRLWFLAFLLNGWLCRP